MSNSIRVVALTFMAVAGSALAQAPAVQELPVDVTAPELVKRVRAAIGDEAAWTAVASMKSVGTIEMDGQSLTLENLEAKGDLNVGTMKVDGAVVSATGCDGKVSWERDENGVRVHEGAELTEGLDDCRFLSDIDLSGYKEIKVAGKAKQGPLTFYLVDAFTARGGHDVITIDAATWMPHSMIVQRHDGGEKITMAAVYSDYRRVSGLLMPHTIKAKFGSVKATIAFTSIVANPPFDKSVFARPTK